MIVNLILNVVVLFIGAIFSWLPAVETLPTIVGFDIDSALVDGMGIVKRFFTFHWTLDLFFKGSLFLVGYYTVKMSLKFLLGHRAPD